jgi:hypothetical protein
MTDFGPLDLRGTIGHKRSYEDLLPHSAVEEIEPGLRVRVVNLETLVATKEEAGREKDLPPKSAASNPSRPPPPSEVDGQFRRVIPYFS